MSREFDALGNLLKETDRNNANSASPVSTTHSYDALNRLTQTLDRLGNPVAFNYDVADHTTQVTDPNGLSTAYVYDDLGNLLTETSPARGTLTYTDDAASNRLTVTDARAITAAYTYDALNRVVSVDYPGTQEDITYTYDTAPGCSNGIGRCAIHAYVLMTNHVHILATPQDQEGIGRMMQYIGRRYVPYVNYTYGTSSSIWEGRYKASLIHDEQYLLTCMRYIELNPVRANMTSSPGQYRFSSYRANAQRREDKLVTPHPLYTRLGKTNASCQEVYRTLFKAHIDAKDLNDIRAAWQTGTPLGNEHFKEKIERKLKSKVGHARRGRPLKRALTP